MTTQEMNRSANVDHAARAVRAALANYMANDRTLANLTDVDYGDTIQDGPCLWLEVDGVIVRVDFSHCPISPA